MLSVVERKLKRFEDRQRHDGQASKWAIGAGLEYFLEIKWIFRLGSFHFDGFRVSIAVHKFKYFYHPAILIRNHLRGVYFQRYF